MIAESAPGVRHGLPRLVEAGAEVVAAINDEVGALAQFKQARINIGKHLARLGIGGIVRQAQQIHQNPCRHGRFVFLVIRELLSVQILLQVVDELLLGKQSDV